MAPIMFLTEIATLKGVGGGGGVTHAIAFKNIILIEVPQISMSLVVVQGSIQDEIFDLTILNNWLIFCKGTFKNITRKIKCN